MKVVEKTLQNGIRLIAADVPDVNSISLLVLFGVGSVNEHIPGLAHFVEHTVFKGTQRRPNAMVINTEVERMGGYFNAATSQEFTEYYIKLPAEFAEKAFDILSDLLFHSNFDEEELEKEKSVVVEEINMYEDTPVRHTSDSFYSLIWKANPLGRQILGTPESVRSIKREDISAFMQQQYIPQNMIISVAGNLAGKNIESLAEAYFGYLPAVAQTDIDESMSLEELVEGPVVQFEQKDLKQAHFCIGVEGLSYKDSGMYPLSVASAVLAEGMGSYLWQKIREEMGASYYLGSEIDAFRKTGLWYINAGVDQEKVLDVVHEIVLGIRKLLKGDVHEEEMQRAKEYLKGDFLINLEGSEEIARYHAHEYLEQGKIVPVDEEKTHIDAVSRDDIVEVVEKMYRKNIYCNILTKEVDLHTLKEILHV